MASVSRLWAQVTKPQTPHSSSLDSMQELCNDMKLLAFDLQDNNRLIER